MTIPLYIRNDLLRKFWVKDENGTLLVTEKGHNVIKQAVQSIDPTLN